MIISISEPVTRAWNRMVRVLFQPFEFGKWLVIAFTAFLTTCGEGGATGWSGPSRNGFTRPGSPSPNMAFLPADLSSWLALHLALILLIAIPVLLMVVAISILLAWLRSRGQFMFVAALARNQADITNSWHEFRDLGNSLFLARLILVALWWVLIVPVVALGMIMAWPGIVLAWPSLRAGTAHAALLLTMLPALIVTAMGFFVIALGLGIARLVLSNLVMPTMFARRARVMEAWSIVRQNILSGHMGTVLLFFIVEFFLAIVARVFMVIGTCCLCCIPAIPYVNTVVFLPVISFLQCYPLYFIQQFGPEFQIFEINPLECPTCGYDLRGNLQAAACPECGQQLLQPSPPPEGPSSPPAAI